MQINLVWIWEDYTVVCCHLTFHAWLVSHHVFCLVWEEAREREKRAITLFSNTSSGGKQGWTMGRSEGDSRGWNYSSWMLDRHLPWGPIAQQCQHGVLFLMRNYAEPEAWTSKLNKLLHIWVHNCQSLNCPACVLQRLLKWCPFSRGYDQYITNRQMGNGAGWIFDTLTLLLYQMLWLHLHILLAGYTHFCLGYGQLITHTKHDITAGVRGI